MSAPSSRKRIQWVAAVVMLATGCTVGVADPSPVVQILDPTSSATHTTASDTVILGGTVENAESVTVANNFTGAVEKVHVKNLLGIVTWITDPVRLVEGTNLITVIGRAEDGREGISLDGASQKLVRRASSSRPEHS